MNRKPFLITLVCEAALILILVLLTDQFPGLFSSTLAFPFEQIAVGLIILSRFGPFGNGLATALWVGISLLPLIAALRYRSDQAAGKETVILYFLSCVLLLALYGMVNPHIFCPLIPETDSAYFAVVKAIIGASVWSVIILYAVLRLIRKFRSGDQASLLRYLYILLHVLCLFFAAAAAISLGNVLTVLIGSPQNMADNAIHFLRSIVVSAPYLLDIAIVLSALSLFDTVMTEEQNGIVDAAKRLSDICCAALGITVAITAVFNVLQIILMRRLSNVTATATIPIVNIVFVGVILLLSRLFVENKRLRDDNSLFI